MILGLLQETNCLPKPEQNPKQLYSNMLQLRLFKERVESAQAHG